jgi:uncharacterized membrane protein YbhN (UPF0104 family)
VTAQILLRLGSAALAMVFSITHLSARPALAAMVSTDAALAAQESAAARDRVSAFLEREDVRARIEALGVSPEEAKARVALLSDEQVAWMDARLAELPAGGSSFLEVVAAILIVLVLFFLITDLMGFTDVFPFVKPMQRAPAR